MFFNTAIWTSLLLGSVVLAADAPTANLTTGVLGDAKVVTDSPDGAAVVAEFVKTKNSTITGIVLATTGQDQTGIQFTIALDGFKKGDAPFKYHIHALPVPKNGSCLATKAHLDPYKRGQVPPCDPSKPETCEVGDLSGKHGVINGTKFTASYLDLFASLNSKDVAYFANLSVVIHNNKDQRVACTNFGSLRKKLTSLASNSKCSTSSTKSKSTKTTGASTATTDTPTTTGDYVSSQTTVSTQLSPDTDPGSVSNPTGASNGTSNSTGPLEVADSGAVGLASTGLSSLLAAVGVVAATILFS